MAQPENTVNVVPCIDTSYSMTSYGYVEITKRDASAFVSYCRPHDGLGVVNFDAQGNVTQAFGIVHDAHQLKDVAKAIDGLKFTGNATAIGLGLQTAEKMLDSQADPRGIVLLSDGYNNAGPPPLTVLPKGYPVYTCAMGQNADNALLKQIADNTPGGKDKFYSAPLPSTMMLIMNQIRGKHRFVRTVANELNPIAPQGFALISAPISDSNSAAQFGVVWDDNALAYTLSASPSPTEISITLVQPDLVSFIQPAIIGQGYVVFDVQNPPAGEWYVQVISGSNSVQVQVTSGAFEFPTNLDAADLVVTTSDSLTAGAPLSVEAKVVENGQPLDGIRIRVEVMHPTMSVADALIAHRDALKRIELTDQDLEGGRTEDQVRLAKLQAESLPSKDIYGHRSFNQMLAAAKGGTHSTTIADTRTPGSYNIHVIAHGTSPATGMFQRSHLVTVLVK